MSFEIIKIYRHSMKSVNVQLLVQEMTVICLRSKVPEKPQVRDGFYLCIVTEGDINNIILYSMY